MFKSGFLSSACMNTSCVHTFSDSCPVCRTLERHAGEPFRKSPSNHGGWINVWAVDGGCLFWKFHHPPLHLHWCNWRYVLSECMHVCAVYICTLVVKEIPPVCNRVSVHSRLT